jgi:hypothetical protein
VADSANKTLSAWTFACFILHETMPTSYVSAVVEVRHRLCEPWPIHESKERSNSQ